MDDLAAATLDVLANALQQCRCYPWIIASAAIGVYARDASVHAGACKMVVQAVIPVLHQIMDEKVTVQVLLQNTDLTRDILTLAGQQIAERPESATTTPSSTPLPFTTHRDFGWQLDSIQQLGQKRRAESPGGSESNKRQKTGTE